MCTYECLKQRPSSSLNIYGNTICKTTLNVVLYFWFLILFNPCRPEELDVKVEGNNIIITAKQEIQEAGGTRQKFLPPLKGQ
jgi:hypothetical protein